MSDAASLTERLIQAAVDYESGRCSRRELSEARAAVEAAILAPAQRDALWMALEAIAMRDQEFGFDAGKVAREAMNSVVETPGSGS